MILSLLLTSCRHTSKATDSKQTYQDPVNKSVTEKDISNIKFTDYTLDTQTEKVIDKWLKYKELETLVDNIKKGDLSYFNDNNKAIQKFIIEFKQSIPDTVNTEPVMARITALETKLYKLESLSNLETTSKQELVKTIKEFLESVSNLNFQMNKKLEKDSQHIEKP